MFNKVLILSATSGAGHVKAAEVLAEAFRQQSLAREVKHVDALQYVSPILRTMYARSYIDLVNKAPHLLGAIYDATDKSGRFDKRRLTFDLANSAPLLRFIEREKPDIIVSTHFLASELVALMKRRKRLDSYTATVVTDFDVHAFWQADPCELYLVALNETSLQLQHMGVEPDRIVVTGIPVSPAFNVPLSKIEARRKLGLDLERPTVLVSNGGFGVGPLADIVESLASMRSQCQIVVLSGKNAQVKIELEEMAQELGVSSRVHMVGYTNDMRTYMAASDIMVGKSGGLTSSECMAAGLPMMIVNPIPGQEERNATHLLEHGCALRSNGLRTLRFKMDELLTDRQRLQAMQENARSFGRADASLAAARTIAERAERYFAQRSRLQAELPERKSRAAKVLGRLKQTRESLLLRAAV